MIIFGFVTFVLGIAFFFLPDKPKSRWFRLTPVEEEIVDERTRDNAAVPSKNIKREHFIEALKEPQLHAYFFISLLINLQNGAMTVFSTRIINVMGFGVSFFP